MLKPDAGLTEREQQVMALLAGGLGNKTIAAKLGLQEKTIKHHLTRVFRKLAVRNRTEAAIAWLGLQTDCPTVGSVSSSAAAGRFREARVAQGIDRKHHLPLQKK
ncbi:MAG: LuxR C-terminal-related transcriptional regulator [Alphaproteobacteria bacterium]|nr:LuxR C-terminal-related transcriptional regulator [Alphaproteobacteria bacterium]MBU1549632.1 LuxR C-terminal-related transcriptional regulator [Alphaproteobacteria bacterium]MBU2336487.1 LuxR C-terminal-related transcriptional regulator [Alphaproteobacteria bacterium]MBU2387632.1 LuxR C-terminal-related transcriptional regulator [Alphaproteobacteria bacterium]